MMAATTASTVILRHWEIAKAPDLHDLVKAVWDPMSLKGKKKKKRRNGI